MMVDLEEKKTHSKFESLKKDIASIYSSHSGDKQIWPYYLQAQLSYSYKFKLKRLLIISVVHHQWLDLACFHPLLWHNIKSISKYVQRLLVIPVIDRFFFYSVRSTSIVSRTFQISCQSWFGGPFICFGLAFRNDNREYKNMFLQFFIATNLSKQFKRFISMYDRLTNRRRQRK